MTLEETFRVIRCDVAFEFRAAARPACYGNSVLVPLQSSFYTSTTVNLNRGIDASALLTMEILISITDDDLEKSLRSG